MQTGPTIPEQRHAVVELVGTGRTGADQPWFDEPSPRTQPLQGRGGDVDWVCGDCGATVVTGIRRPELLRTIELRCPACRSYQHRGA